MTFMMATSTELSMVYYLPYRGQLDINNNNNNNNNKKIII